MPASRRRTFGVSKKRRNASAGCVAFSRPTRPTMTLAKWVRCEHARTQTTFATRIVKIHQLRRGCGLRRGCCSLGDAVGVCRRQLVCFSTRRCTFARRIRAPLKALPRGGSTTAMPVLPPRGGSSASCLLLLGLHEHGCKRREPLLLCRFGDFLQAGATIDGACGFAVIGKLAAELAQP